MFFSNPGLQHMACGRGLSPPSQPAYLLGGTSHTTLLSFFPLQRPYSPTHLTPNDLSVRHWRKSILEKEGGGYNWSPIKFLLRFQPLWNYFMKQKKNWIFEIIFLNYKLFFCFWTFLTFSDFESHYSALLVYFCFRFFMTKRGATAL